MTAEFGMVVEGDRLVSYSGSDQYIFIPDGVRVICRNAFAGSSVKSISIPASVICIEQNAFSECKMLSSIKWSANVQSIGDGAFEFCKKITALVLPKSSVLNSIGKRAFAHCYSLKKVELGASLKTMGESCFEKCIQLESVVIAAGLSYVEADTFKDCIALKTFETDGEPQKVSDSAFTNCVAYGGAKVSEESQPVSKSNASVGTSEQVDYATELAREVSGQGNSIQAMTESEFLALANGKTSTKPAETTTASLTTAMQETETYLNIAVRNNILWDIVSSNRIYGMVAGIEIDDMGTYFMIMVGEGVHEVVPRTIEDAHKGIIRYLSQVVSDKSELDRNSKKILDNYDYIQWCDEEIKPDDDEEEAKTTILECFNGLAEYREGDEDAVLTYYGYTKAELGMYVKSADLWNGLAGIDFGKYGIKVDLGTLAKSGETLFVSSYRNGWNIMAEKLDELTKELSAVISKNGNKSIFFAVQQPEIAGVKYIFDFGEGLRDQYFDEDDDIVMDFDAYLSEYADISDINVTIKELSGGYIGNTFTEEECDNMRAFGIDVDAIDEELMNDTRYLIQ